MRFAKGFLVFAISLLLTTSCCKPRASEALHTNPGEPKGAGTAREVHEVPVVVTSRFQVDSLASNQLHAIIDKAQERVEVGKRVWFIALRMNHTRDGEQICSGDVYFAPDSENARVRRGRVFSFDSSRDAVAKQLNSLIEDLDDDCGTTQATSRPLPTYVQISKAEMPFDGRLDLPSGVLMPFRTPTDFSESELVSVMDFVHGLPPSPHPPGFGGIAQEFDNQAPIVWIERDGNQIDIHSGVMEGFLCGGGDFLRIIIEDGQYRIDGIGSWVS